MIRRRFHDLLLLLALANIMGCGTRDVIVEHIQFDTDQGTFRLGRSAVTTFLNQYGDAEIYSPRVKDLEGEHVVIRGGGRVGGDLCRAAGINVETLTREQYFTLGVVSRPEPVRLSYNVDNLDRNGDGRPDGAIVPTDHDSLAMLSAYVAFDDVARFFREELGDRSHATASRAQVAFYGEFAVGCDLSASLPGGANGRGGVSLPMVVGDNAAYAPLGDMFIIMRDAVLSNRAELGINPGVLAHEFGHRLFVHNVYADDAAFRAMVRHSLGRGQGSTAQCSEGNEEERRLCAITDVMLRAMSEGIADVLAYAFTGQPDILLQYSFSSDADETQQRNLAGDPGREGAVPFYTEDVVDQAASDPQFQFYRLGTLWARGFYHGIVNPISGARPANERERVDLVRTRYGSAVLRALGRLGEDLAVSFRFDPRQYLRRYIQEAATDATTGADNALVRAATCQALCDRFGELPFHLVVNHVPAQCAGVEGNNPHAASGGLFRCTL